MSQGDGVRRVPIRDLVMYYLRLGAVGFGGPVALVGQMEKELVQERGWLTKDEFREGVAVCQSLPGPLAIQVGIFIAYLRGGFWGAWAGGWAFILPNFIFVATLGALFVYFGDLPPIKAIFYGVSPAVIAMILYSCYRLAALGMEDRLQWGIAAACLAITVALRAEVALLFIVSGVIGILWYGTLLRRWRAPALPLLAALPPAAGSAPSAGILGKLLVFFLKAGSLTFGSGLVIVAPILIRHRGNPNVQGFVKGAYAAAIGTILGAAVLLGKIAIGDWLTALIALVSLVALARRRVGNPALVAMAAAVGLVGFSILKPAWVFV